MYKIVIALALVFCSQAFADEAFLEAIQEKNYSLAASQIEQELKADSLPSSQAGRLWYFLGVCRNELGDLAGAKSAYLEALERTYVPARSGYNLACVEALMGDASSALSRLKIAVDAGFDDPEHLQTDRDLVSLHDSAEFDSLVAGADKNARPCLYLAEHRELDFMLGEWDVYGSDGRRIGASEWTVNLNGCVIREHWKDPGGGEGESINYFDPAEKKWKQNWVDATGWVTYYSGEFRDGAMRYQGRSSYMDGSTKLGKSTFTPQANGTINHIIQRSQDGGKSWYVTFDAVYRKRGSASD